MSGSNNIIPFSVVKAKAARSSPPAEEEIDAKRRQRNDKRVKFRKCKKQYREFGGGYRKRAADITNPNRLATIEIDKAKWRSPEYRETIAATVLKVLLESRVIGIGVSPPGLYRFVGGRRERLSDRMIQSCLAKHLNFTRNAMSLRPPP